jgi:hypothetical protein
MHIRWSAGMGSKEENPGTVNCSNTIHLKYLKVKYINYSGTTPYSLRASASLHMEEYTCNSKGGNHQKPQTHPTEQLV